jgi:hypothetical protein
MPKIHWYGPINNRGPESTNARVAYTKRTAAAVRLKAIEIAHDAAFNLDSRPETRTGDSEIRTRHYPSPGFQPQSTGQPVIDSFVLLTDSWEGNEKGHKGATHGIEATHNVLKDAVANA